MGNHFHMVIETTQPNLVVGMKWLLGTYCQDRGIPNNAFSGMPDFIG